MKKVLAILLAAMLLLSLAACGGKDDPKPSGNSGGDTPPASSQQTEQSTSQGDNTKPEKEWPTDQITAWSGSGKIVKIEDLSSYTQNYTFYCILNVDAATLDEFTAYISELESAGFSYKSLEEATSAGYIENDYSYSWNGYTADESKRVQITLDKDDSKLEIAMWIV